MKIKAIYTHGATVLLANEARRQRLTPHEINLICTEAEYTTYIGLPITRSTLKDAILSTAHQIDYERTKTGEPS